MDEHINTRFFVILVFFMVISQVEKIETSSIIHKPAQKFNKRKEK
jgi:hypothetical protein